MLRSRLLRLYIDTGRVNEAYSHAVEVEKKGAYPDSIEWYQCLQDIYQVHYRFFFLGLGGWGEVDSEFYCKRMDSDEISNEQTCMFKNIGIVVCSRFV